MSNEPAAMDVSQNDGEGAAEIIGALGGAPADEEEAEEVGQWCELEKKKSENKISMRKDDNK